MRAERCDATPPGFAITLRPRKLCVASSGVLLFCRAMDATTEGSRIAGAEVAERPSLLIPAIVAGIYFLVLMLTCTHYGYFRDALYYLACSEHLAWGYVDQPPLIVFIGWISRHTLGTSLPALMLWPALAGAGRIVLTAAFARELGAKKFGMGFAALLAATPGVWYVIDHQFAMNALEPLFWTGCAFAILRMIRTDNPKLWLVFGVISGLGLENKYSVAVFAFALLLGLLLTPQRKFLFTPWLFAGGGVALLMFLPNLLWNVQHHWPFLELMHNIRESGRDVVLSPGQFIVQQVLLMNPTSAAFWIRGVLFYFFARTAKEYRVFGWAFVITFVFFLLAHGKNYYSAPMYTIAFAGGALAVERFLAGARFAGRPALRTGLQTALVALVILGIFPMLPVVLPILPIETYLRYQEHLPIAIPRSEHGHEGTPLPQHYADEFGWEEMVAATAQVYHSSVSARAKQNRHLRQQLRRSRGHRFFRPEIRFAQSHQRPSELFLLGTSRLHRRNCHRSRQRGSGQRPQIFPECRSSGGTAQSLFHPLRAPSNFVVPRPEGKFANPLAEPQALGLEQPIHCGRNSANSIGANGLGSGIVQLRSTG